MQVINSLNELKELCEEEKYFKMALNYGCYSRKAIRYNKKTGKFRIWNLIDGSRQYLTPREMNDTNKTNIGRAIKQGALVLE